MPIGVYPHGHHSEITKKKMSLSHRKDRHWNWKGGKRINSLGYVMVKTGPKKYRHEHRLVMEAHLGRPLQRGEVVHHKNHTKTDNRIENLELMTKSEHHRLHANHRWHGDHLIENKLVKP